MRALALGVLVLLVLPLVPAPVAEAQAPRELEWEYRVSLPDLASGRAHVEVRFRNLQGIVDRMTFLTLDHREPVTLDPSHPDTLLTIESGGFSFGVDGALESFGFEVDLRRDAFKEGQYLSWAGEDFALFKAEAFALAFTYRYYEGKPFVWKPRVVLDAPEGWNAWGPWAPLGGGAFALPDGEVLPRGYVAFGPFADPEPVEAGGKIVRYVRLGEPGAYERAMVDYIDRATPYYEAVYGAGTGRHLLVINAPDPMFRGGLGAADSFFVHETADLRTVAHEYAHVFQRFGTVETAGRAAVWLNEGDADLHSALSLLAAEVWSPADVQDFFDEAASDRRDLGLEKAKLVDATYGTSLERFAYRKGLMVLRALDEEIARASGGAAGLNDLVRRLNAKHGIGTNDTPELVSNDDIRAEASALAGVALDAFFDAYVHGDQWPEPAPFAPRGELVVSDLRLEPMEASAGEAVTVTVNVSNGGTTALDRALTLRVDGAERDRTTLRLSVGQSMPVSFSFVAPDAPGDHEVRVAYLDAAFRTLTPADLRLDRVDLIPSSPRAGEDATLLVFVRNGGEQAGTGHVEVLDGDVVVRRSEQLFVAGGADEPVTLPVRFGAAGESALAVRLVTPGEDDERIVHATVRPADRDGDGIPDGEDAYPFNPRIAQGSVVNDARDKVPLPWWTPLAAVALVALLGHRSR